MHKCTVCLQRLKFLQSHAHAPVQTAHQGSPHQLKFPVRRNETDAPLWLKLAELDTLVESAVVNGNTLSVLVTRPAYPPRANITNVIQIPSNVQHCLSVIRTPTSQLGRWMYMWAGRGNPCTNPFNQAQTGFPTYILWEGSLVLVYTYSCQTLCALYPTCVY